MSMKLLKAESLNHPLITGQTPIGLMSAEAPKFPDVIPSTHRVSDPHKLLLMELRQRGHRVEDTHGRYGTPERSVIIHGIGAEELMELGKKYGQESVVHSEGGHQKMVYTNGPQVGFYNPSKPDIEVRPTAPPDNFTYVPGTGYVTIGFDWDKLHPMSHPEVSAPTEQEPDASQPAEEPKQELAKAVGDDMATRLAPNNITRSDDSFDGRALTFRAPHGVYHVGLDNDNEDTGALSRRGQPASLHYFGNDGSYERINDSPGFVPAILAHHGDVTAGRPREAAGRVVPYVPNPRLVPIANPMFGRPVPTRPAPPVAKPAQIKGGLESVGTHPNASVPEPEHKEHINRMKMLELSEKTMKKTANDTQDIKKSLAELIRGRIEAFELELVDLRKKEESSVAEKPKAGTKLPGAKTQDLTPKGTGSGELHKAGPPMAKPPSGASTPAAPPVSKPMAAGAAPKAPKAAGVPIGKAEETKKSLFNVKAEDKLDKAALPGTIRGDAQSAAANAVTAAAPKIPGRGTPSRDIELPGGPPLALDQSKKVHLPGVGQPLPVAQGAKLGTARPVMAPLGNVVGAPNTRPGIFGKLDAQKKPGVFKGEGSYGEDEKKE